ncbi:FAD-binding and (Fe-S)-binding domain-containing protein [Swingsia samuiensis]|uniref:D-2-hydroxyglutarate dehydrogenase n=1 Tax=Swingsia samuiensis TaxID=1293412 RepID=A0A4Y6UHJ4_9PROT|nr:FAD-binding and (Fe-S)-binding domain-containing protein [Swingsia samuiensis]QDH16138.1 FAD-binding oxidoreductase [Swingsia samuiensis]
MGDFSTLNQSDLNSGLSLSPSLIKQREHFLSQLSRLGFEGDITSEVSARVVASTDNSIYQRLPLAIIYPKTQADLNKAVKAAQNGSITLAIRGGGTGTNGQSLSSGIIIDVARHLDRIVFFDEKKQTVTVEPGVILSRLNAFLKPHGFFFPPTVSTATRATIGGMVATDASGKGSRLYGKTSDYIESMKVVLSDGNTLLVKKESSEDLKKIIAQNDLPSRIYRQVITTVTEHKEEINRVFPKMNRGLTGYNLQNILSEEGSINLTRLLAGSEGTLALTKQITLKIKKLPKVSQLIVIRYDNFDHTLRDIQTLLPANPLAIEVLDDRLLEVASQDVIWQSLENILGTQSHKPVRGISFVEFVGDDLSLVKENVNSTLNLIVKSPFEHIDFKVISDESIIKKLWDLRAKAVGLLGQPESGKQGVAFIEDTAVPPEVLADYVVDFKSILDRHNLPYGMFGHADVGCLHVRPFLNMLEPKDQALIRPISDEVAQLTKAYGGLLWGEHGRGFRGEFSPLFFGEKLFKELIKIKQQFDFKDIFNRGKLVPGEEYSVDRIDEVPFKGQYDAQISAPFKQDYQLALNCNGNGACFNKEPDTVMCPSYKATKDRVQSPKGRATLLRTWARLTSLPDGVPDKSTLSALTEELKRSLDTCLACKACSTQCPIHVDIPSMRSNFFANYFQTNKRPLRDYLIFGLEFFLKISRQHPDFTNFFTQNPVSKIILKRLGIVDLPKINSAKISSQDFISKEWIKNNYNNPKAVIILQDPFTSSFDGDVLKKTLELFNHIGINARATKVLNNGKAKYIRGFKKSFNKTAQKTLNYLHPLTQLNIPLISLDAATGAMFKQEFKEFGKDNFEINVLSVETYLKHLIENELIPQHKFSPIQQEFTLIPHCTEQAMYPTVTSDWMFIFKTLLSLPLNTKKAGCCGMAGLFGHEAENVTLSKKIFQQNWASTHHKEILATGFSCRCQTKRLTGYRPSHPIEILFQSAKNT